MGFVWTAIMFGKIELVINTDFSSNYMYTFCLLQNSKEIELLYNKVEHKSEHKRLVGKVLDKKLAKAVPKNVEIAIKNLLDGDMWPLVLSIHSEFSRKLKKMFCHTYYIIVVFVVLINLFKYNTYPITHNIEGTKYFLHTHDLYIFKLTCSYQVTEFTN